MIEEHVFTPQEAKAIVTATIGENYNFRKASPNERATQRIVDMMRRGEWRWREAGPIRLSSDRRLCSDGVHRLLGCAISGMPLRSVVMIGDDYVAGVHTDKNERRTLGQYLTNQGMSSGSSRAALTVLHLSRLYADLRGISVAHADTTLVHEDEVVEFARKHEATSSWVLARQRPASQRGFNQNGYAVFLLEATFADPDTSELFHQTFTGVTENENDPIHRLRQFQWRRFDTTGRRMSATQTVDAFVKCWGHWLAGEQIKLWRPPFYETVRFPSGFKNPMREMR